MLIAECLLCERVRKLTNKICTDCRLVILINDAIRRKEINAYNVTAPVKGIPLRF